MSKKHKPSSATSNPAHIAPVKGQTVTATRDGLSNFAAALGTGANNLLAQSTYSFNFITKNRILLEAMYRTSWVIGAAVDYVADDMTQAGIEIKSTMSPDDMEKLDEGMEDLQIWQSLCSTIKWSRLYGTGMGLILIDGQDFSTPLRLDTVGEGQFKGILPMDRWQFVPDVGRPITELGPKMGLPKFYNTSADAILPSFGKIHHSRLIRIDAIELPHYQKMTENMWCESIIERIFDRLVAFDSTTVGAAQLVFKAFLRTWTIKDLRNLISQGSEKAYQAVLKNIETTRALQSNEGITLIDGEDKFETQSYNFAGLDDVLLQFAQQLSGATEIPMVRFYGQEPAGLGSTGESSLRTYYDGIKKKQKKDLRRPVKLILELVSRSVLGNPLPDGFGYEFKSLWQLTETEKAEIANKDANTMATAADAQLITQQTAMKELRQSSHVSGRFSNITDEDIELGEDDFPTAEDAADPDAEGGDGKTSATDKP